MRQDFQYSNNQLDIANYLEKVHTKKVKKTQGITEFKVKNRMNKSWVRVLVYDDVQQMRKESDDYDEKLGHARDNGDIAGLSYHYCREQFDEKGKQIGRKNDIGIIRLCKKYLSTEVVAHELLHAALWNYRLNYGTEHEFEGSIENACFGQGCNDDEETLCHLYGQMFRDMTRKLYKKGLWA